jgi:hypothetical protein
VEELDNLRKDAEISLEKYALLARRMGYCATYRIKLGTDVIADLEDLCEQVAKEFRDPTFFSGKLIFARENFFSKFLHNDTAYELQRRLLFKGFNMVIVPIRVL